MRDDCVSMEDVLVEDIEAAKESLMAETGARWMADSTMVRLLIEDRASRHRRHLRERGLPAHVVRLADRIYGGARLRQIHPPDDDGGAAA